MKYLKEILKFIEEKGRFVIFTLLGIAVFLLSIVFWQFFQKNTKEEEPEGGLYEELLAEAETEHEENSDTENNDEETTTAELIVDVKGAVNSPGVYHMIQNSRVVDVIEKADGFHEEAEQNAVNLAQILEDQMVIYVPKVGEEGIELDYSTQSDSNTSTKGEEATNKVDINRADKEELTTLSGIGASKAESIISYREESGNFQAIEDLKQVSGIGEATFDQLKDFIIVSP